MHHRNPAKDDLEEDNSFGFDVNTVPLPFAKRQKTNICLKVVFSV